jgi:S1-C subfamily serine protease
LSARPAIVRAVALGLLAIALVPALAQRRPRGPVRDESEGGQTPAVFRRFAPAVQKVQVIETRSGAKAVTGSGFAVTPDGHAITNYHVVAKLVHDPDRYRVEVTDQAGRTRAVRVVAVDVVHDLAVLETGARARQWFTLRPVPIAQGRRLYSLGHPGDLGIAIVEGTYNGRLPHTLYPRIHFTGSLNPGMSGGPTITREGQVVGINVATSGNQQSFLVPVDDAARLLRHALASGPRPADSLLADVGRQLLSYQQDYLGDLLEAPVPAATLGHWRVPTSPADFFNCWGDSDEEVDQPYVIVHHYCSTDDDIFLTGDESTGIIDFQHDLLSSEKLNRFQFHALMTRKLRALSRDWEIASRGDEDFTPYRCRTGNVRERGVTAKAVLCARRYKRMPGLYDVVFRLATLGEPRTGLLTTLTMSGVSFANAQTMVRRYVGAIRRGE